MIFLDAVPLSQEKVSREKEKETGATPFEASLEHMMKLLEEKGSVSAMPSLSSSTMKDESEAMKLFETLWKSFQESTSSSTSASTFATSADQQSIPLNDTQLGEDGLDDEFIDSFANQILSKDILFDPLKELSDNVRWSDTLYLCTNVTIYFSFVFSIRTG
jgi:hypothetical protein